MLRHTPEVFLLALVLAVASYGCSRVAPGPAPRGERRQPAEARPGAAGAYDVVKMDRFGTRRGPVYFAHTLHAELPGLDGKTIACAYCHFEKCGPPRRCGACHVGRRRRKPGQPRLPST